MIKGKLFPPRFFDGREFELWTKKISASIGIDAPATVEELAEQSTTPFLSRLSELDRKVDGLERKLATAQSDNHELRRRIDDLERSL